MSAFDSNHGDDQTSLMPDNHNYDMNSQNIPKPEDDRKLFVGKSLLSRSLTDRLAALSGGLTWDTTPDDLREYFSSFGNILDCSIKHDPTTGRSRGFAFLVFDRKEIVEKILSQNEHFVKGRKVDPKPAHRRLAQTNMNHQLSSLSSHSLSNNNRKVFVGGVDPNFPDVQLREYFSRFGPIDGKTNTQMPSSSPCFLCFVKKLICRSIKKRTNDVHSVLSPFKMNNQRKRYFDCKSTPSVM